MEYSSAIYNKKVIYYFGIFMAAAVLSLWPAASDAATQTDSLQRNSSAAALGMGGAYSTMTEDSGAIHYNPACLYGLKKVEISGSSSRSEFDQRTDGINYTFFNGPKKRAYGGFTYIKDEIGEIEGRDAAGKLTSYFSDKAEIIGYGIGNTNNYLKKQGISYGVLAKYLSHKVASASASGYALDIGFLKEMTAGARFALTVKNLSGTLKWSGTASNPVEKPGRAIGVGYSAICFKDARAAVELTRDASQNGKIVKSAGLEKRLNEKAVARLGSCDGKMSYGLGFNLNQSKIDYSFSKNDACDFHKISGVFYFE